MPNDALMAQLLEWIGEQPRKYIETIEAWRTSCPRLAIFEDALSFGLVERMPGATLADAKIRVTKAGRDFLRNSERVHAQVASL